MMTQHVMDIVALELATSADKERHAVGEVVTLSVREVAGRVKVLGICKLRKDVPNSSFATSGT